MDKGTPRGRSLLPAMLAISLCVVVFYSPTLTGEFLLDDHVLIRSNPFVKQSQSLMSYLVQEDGILDRDDWEGDYHTGYYRPLINLTYFIDYRIWGMNPVGFRISNLLFHILACGMLFIVLRRQSARYLPALGVCLLFALHPVHTESVSWVASRNNILATFFGLAAFHCATVSGDRGQWLLRGLAVLCFLVSMFCKEFGVMLLPILFLHRRLLGKEKRITVKEMAGYLPYAAVLVIYLWARVAATGAVSGAETTAPVWYRIAFVPYLIAFNFSLLLFPLGLHNFLVVYPDALMSIQMLAGVAVGGLLVLALWAWRGRPMVVFGILAFLAGLFPVMNILPTASATLIAMRWLYFPSAFLSMGICALVDARGGRKTAVIMAGVLLFYGTQTYFLNRDHWHDEDTFFANEVLLHQNRLYAGALAERYARKGDLARAEKYFRQGMAAYPDMVENHINYAAMLIENGRPEAALAVIDNALTLHMTRTNRSGLHSNRGMALTRMGRIAEGAAELEEARRLTPDKPGILLNLGTAYGMLGRFDDAAAVLEHGITIAPDSPGMRRNLAVTYIHAGRYQAAIDILEAIPPAQRQRDPAVGALLQEARDKRDRDGAPTASERQP